MGGMPPEPATGALIVGILAIILAFFTGGLLGIILGFIAIYLGSKAKKEGRQYGNGAFILGILAVVISIIWLIIALVILATFGLF